MEKKRYIVEAAVYDTRQIDGSEYAPDPGFETDGDPRRLLTSIWFETDTLVRNNLITDFREATLQSGEPHEPLVKTSEIK